MGTPTYVWHDIMVTLDGAHVRLWMGRESRVLTPDTARAVAQQLVQFAEAVQGRGACASPLAASQAVPRG